jgi:hypothetical protein
MRHRPEVIANPLQLPEAVWAPEIALREHFDDLDLRLRLDHARDKLRPVAEATAKKRDRREG